MEWVSKVGKLKRFKTVSKQCTWNVSKAGWSSFKMYQNETFQMVSKKFYWNLSETFQLGFNETRFRKCASETRKTRIKQVSKPIETPWNANETSNTSFKRIMVCWVGSLCWFLKWPSTWPRWTFELYTVLKILGSTFNEECLVLCLIGADVGSVLVFWLSWVHLCQSCGHAIAYVGLSCCLLYYSTWCVLVW